jgi:hypothetical protein
MASITKVHPAADIFPMLSDDDLGALAESIKANGLRYPILIRRVLNGGTEPDIELLDGRNRLAACKIAGVDPTFSVFEGDDEAALALIADVNLERRDLKKSQKAMAFAMIYPERGQGGRGKKGPNDWESFGKQFLTEARAVRAHSRALAGDVLADRIGLREAYDKVKQEKAAALGVDARKARLRSEAPDLADLVDDDRLKLNDAVAALEERMRERAHRIKDGQSAGEELWRDISSLLSRIAHAAEFGVPYEVPPSERELAEQVWGELGEILHGKK